jgi:acetolactate synthase I/III small subunit
MEHEHVLTTLVENRPGVLTRISGLFSARGFNIDSLAVGETEDPSVSRMTIVVRGDDRILEQVTKQLNKLIDVIKVQDYGTEDFVQRELILIKVNTESKSRAEIMQIADIFRARIIDVSTKTVTLELTGDQGKIAAMLDLLKPFGVREIARTGRIAMSRG